MMLIKKSPTTFKFLTFYEFLLPWHSQYGLVPDLMGLHLTIHTFIYLITKRVYNVYQRPRKTAIYADGKL